MIPGRFEYIFLLVMLGLILIAVFYRAIGPEIRKVTYWAALSVFCVGCTLLELIALSLGWWTFNPSKILGVQLLGIPIEEYVLFAGFFILVTGLSESTPNDMD